ncbi:MAG: ATP-binding protein, partial [Pseudomonadota bacterium]
MKDDRFRYFRVEARELLTALEQGLLRLERGELDAEGVRALLRAAHTLKGAARVVELPEIAAHAHAIEDRLVEPGAGSGSGLGELFASVDAIRSGLAALDGPAPDRTRAEPRAEGRAEAAPRTLHVEPTELDRVLEGLLEATLLARGVRRAAALGLDEAALAARLDALDAALLEARLQTERIRLVPARRIFPVLERAVRDAAREVGRSVTLETQGGDVRLDAHVAWRVQEALLHAVRNAVAHGIEPSPERRAAGKPEVGRITLTVAQRRHRIAFTCRDDGRGIDVAALRHVLERRGEPVADLDDRALLARLFAPGISTQTDASVVSGRGIGLDVVRTVLEELKGEAVLESQAGEGTTLTLLVPLTLATLPVITVESAGILAAIPLEAVRTTRRVPATEIERSLSGERVAEGGEALPVLRLASVFGRDADTKRPALETLLVLETASGNAALLVDRVRGVEDVILRPLPPTAEADAVVMGAFFGAEGPPCVVLAPSVLAERAASAPRAAPSAQGEPERSPVLVIDDSLTTRMLE